MRASCFFLGLVFYTFLLIFSLPSVNASETPPYALEMSRYHSCAINDNGVTCWGSDNVYGELDVPKGLVNVSQVETTKGLSCAIALGELRCWGDEEKLNNIPLDSINVSDVSLTEGRGCIVANSTHQCWINYDSVENSAFLRTFNELTDIVNIDLFDLDFCWQKNDQSYSCYIKDETSCDSSGCADSNGVNNIIGVTNFEVAGALSCVYGSNVLACDHIYANSGYGIVNTPKGLSGIKDVAISGYRNACVLHDQGVSCWGGGHDEPPENLGLVYDIAASNQSGFCAVTDTGVNCWGYGLSVVTSIPKNLTEPTQVYAAASSPDNFNRRACAKHAEGIDCWGERKRSRLTLQQPYKLFSSSSSFCALDDTGVSCSGVNAGTSFDIPDIPESFSDGVTDAAIASNLCVIKNGEPICIATDDTPVLHPPAGLSDLVDIEINETAACTTDIEGRLACWESNSYFNLAKYPDGPDIAVTLAAGKHHTCALDQNGVKCWGQNDYGQLDVPVGLGNVTELTAGENWTCATHESGETCWGFERHSPPADLGNVSSVDSASNHSCAINSTGVHCWGSDTYGQSSVPAGIDAPINVKVSNTFSCAQSNDTLSCWGNKDALTSLPQNLSNIQQWGLNDLGGCVLDDLGVQCWGIYTSDVPADLANVSKLAIGGDRTCALAQGVVSCWGRFPYHAVVPDLTDVKDIMIAGQKMCALESNRISCWGSTGSLDENLTKDITNISSVDAGENHICAIKQNKVECWAKANIANQVFIDVPVAMGSIKQVTMGKSVACAIGDLANACWGRATLASSYINDYPDNFQQAEQIAIGSDTSACMLDNGNVTCWGRRSNSPMPVGLTGVTEIKAQDGTFCALHSDKLSCWGFESFSSPDSWEGIIDFSIIASSTSRDICAITSSGVKCRYRTSPHSIDSSNFEFASSSTHSCILQNGNVSCSAFSQGEYLPQFMTMGVPESLGMVSKVFAFDRYISCAQNQLGIICWDQQGKSVLNIEGATQLDYDAKENDYCYVKDDRLICEGARWGWNGKSLKSTQNTKFLASKSGRGCFVENGLLVCNSGNTPLVDNLTADDQIAVGKWHMCINRAGEVICYGDNSYAQIDVPLEFDDVTAIAVGTYHSCAANISNVTCWGKNDSKQLDVPSGLTSVSKLVAGLNFSCALTTNGVVCWGDKDDSRGDLPEYFITEIPELSNVRDIAAGDTFMCAVDDIGVKCWGKPEVNNSLQHEQYLVKSPLVTKLTVGDSHACVVAKDELSCYYLRDWSKLALDNDTLGYTEELFIDGKKLCSVVGSGLNCINLTSNERTFTPILNSIKGISFNKLETCVKSGDEVICFNKQGITRQQIQPNAKVISNDGHNDLCVFGDEISCLGSYGKPQYNFSNRGAVSSLALGDNYLCYISSGVIGCEHYGGSRPSEYLIFFNDNDNDGILDYLDADDDNDGVSDEQEFLDGTDSLNSNSFKDTDADGIADALDNDIDGDGLSNLIEIGNGLDPLNPNDANADFDSDGLTNAEEITLGTDLNAADSDGDDVNDNVEIANGSDPLDENSIVGRLGMLSLFNDTNADGVNDWIRYNEDEQHTIVKFYSGDNFDLLNEFTVTYPFDDVVFYTLQDRDFDDIQELGIFGFDSSKNRYQLLVHSGASGAKLGAWNWPAAIGDVSFEALADLTGDGIQEYAISGVHLINGTRQLVVKDGMTRGNYHTFKWPNQWDLPKFVIMTDITSDGTPEVALHGKHERLDKGQLFVYDGANPNSKLDVYNWNPLWDDISLHQMDDLDGDGATDWGQFGKRKDDGRYQWLVKKGSDKRGVIRTFSWPNDLINVKPLLVSDRTDDGIREVAIIGSHPTTDKVFVRVNDGRLANQRIANFSWPGNWEDTLVVEVGDLNNDGFNEFALLGYTKTNRAVQVIVKDGRLTTEYGRYTLPGKWEGISLSHYDTNNDGIEDIVIKGINQAQQALVLTSLRGEDLSLLASQIIN